MALARLTGLCATAIKLPGRAAPCPAHCWTACWRA